MGLQIAKLTSELAAGGPPLFFPDPTVPVTFNFDQGLAAEETFPLDDFKALATEVLDRDGARALEYISFDYDADDDRLFYSPTYVELVLGNTELRREIAAWVGRLQQRPDLGAENVILCSGSVQGISLAFNAFLEPGDGVIVEAASFPYALRYIEMRGGDIRTVPVDGDGIDVGAVEAQLKALRDEGIRPKMIYTIPTFQLPTGVCTSLDRRRRLLELADEYDVMVLEDHVYADLRVEGDHIPSLLQLDTTGRVIQAHSFSKIVAPGIRLGWMTAGAEVIGALAAVRQDLGVSQWFARMMTEFMRQGKLDPHIEAANVVYRRRRDLAVAAMREHCGELVDFRVPDGGFYLWVEMTSDRGDWDQACHQASADGVFFRPGEVFMGEEQGRRFLRLAFSHVPEVELTRGIEVLGRAMRGAVR